MGEFELIVKEGLRKVGDLNKAQQKEFKALNQKITQEAVESLIDEVRGKYTGSEKIIDYLNSLQEDIVRHVQDFIVKPEDMGMPSFMQEFANVSPMSWGLEGRKRFARGLPNFRVGAVGRNFL